MDPWAGVPVPPEVTAWVAGVALGIVWAVEAAFVAMVLLGLSQPLAVYFLAFWTLMVGLAMLLLWRDFTKAIQQVRTHGRGKRLR